MTDQAGTLVLPRHLPQAARPDWGGTPVSRRLKLPKQAMSPVPLVRLVLLASPALSVPPGGSFASSDPKRIAAGRAQRRLVFRILLAAWLPPAVVLVRQPQQELRRERLRHGRIDGLRRLSGLYGRHSLRGL